MFLIPNEVFVRYLEYLSKRGISTVHQGQYKKWLRYYLDFCDKYPVPVANSDRIRLFCKKLQEKKQCKTQQEQAAHSSLKTTKIYTHCVPVRTIKEPRSPLDF